MFNQKYTQTVYFKFVHQSRTWLKKLAPYSAFHAKCHDSTRTRHTRTEQNRAKQPITSKFESPSVNSLRPEQARNKKKAATKRRRKGIHQYHSIHHELQLNFSNSVQRGKSFIPPLYVKSFPRGNPFVVFSLSSYPNHESEWIVNNTKGMKTIVPEKLLRWSNEICRIEIKGENSGRIHLEFAFTRNQRYLLGIFRFLGSDSESSADRYISHA